MPKEINLMSIFSRNEKIPNISLSYCFHALSLVSFDIKFFPNYSDKQKVAISDIRYLDS